MKFCYFFNKGHCHKGSACDFDHSSSDNLFAKVWENIDKKRKLKEEKAAAKLPQPKYSYNNAYNLKRKPPYPHGKLGKK